MKDHRGRAAEGCPPCHWGIWGAADASSSSDRAAGDRIEELIGRYKEKTSRDSTHETAGEIRPDSSGLRPDLDLGQRESEDSPRIV
jgi:hypothetical protein